MPTSCDGSTNPRKRVRSPSSSTGGRGRRHSMQRASTWCRDDGRVSRYSRPRDDSGALRRDHTAMEHGRLRTARAAQWHPTLYPAHRRTPAPPQGYFTATDPGALSHAFQSGTRSGKALDPPLSSGSTSRHIAPLPELDGSPPLCLHGIQSDGLAGPGPGAGPLRRTTPTVLNNHRAKVFLPVADPDTLEYASRLIATRRVTTPSITRTPGGRRPPRARVPADSSGQRNCVAYAW